MTNLRLMPWMAVTISTSCVMTLLELSNFRVKQSDKPWKTNSQNYIWWNKNKQQQQ